MQSSTNDPWYQSLILKTLQSRILSSQACCSDGEQFGAGKATTSELGRVENDSRSCEKRASRDTSKLLCRPLYPRPKTFHFFSPLEVRCARKGMTENEACLRGVCGPTKRSRGVGEGPGPPRELPDSPPPAQTPAADTKPRAGREGAAHGAPRPRERGRGMGAGEARPPPSLAPRSHSPRRERRGGHGG